jgi:sugar phosphate isomerase/epimerase
MEFGIQLFGCMPLFRKSPEEFFAAVSQYGYTNIEPCIVFGDHPEFAEFQERFWSLDELEGFKKLMDRYGLRVESFHAFGDLENHFAELDRVTELFHIRFLVMNTPKPEEEEMAKFLQQLNVVAAHMETKQVQVLLHNHADAIAHKENGVTMLESLLKNAKHSVGAQVDVGWVLYGGEDPLEYIKKLGTDCACIHYKDIKKDYQTIQDEHIHICLGSGAVEVEPIVHWAVEHQLPQVVDQDMSDGDFMADLKESVAVLKRYSGEAM